MGLRVVVQQARLRRIRGAYDMLQVPLGVCLDFGFGVFVACPRNEDSRVDDDSTKALEVGFETGKYSLSWPYVGRQVLGEVIRVKLGG